MNSDRLGRRTDSWHVSDGLAARYADGTLPEADAWSLERHVERCGGCAARVSEAVRRLPAPALVLAGVRDAVLNDLVGGDVPEPLPTPPAPRARLWSSFLDRALWAAGPAVRGAWLPAVVLVALGALGLAYGAHVDGVRPLLLALAPVVPVAGVALSYGRYADPLHEIAAATPSGGLRLVLTRTAAVLGVSLPLLTVTGLLLPASGAPGAAAWLLPGLTLTLASLALSGYVGCRTATAVTGGGWLAAVLAPVLTSPGGTPVSRLAEQLSRCLDGAPAQGAWAAAAVLCAAVLAVRRGAYDGVDRR
ncbi:zf-HC2 domain-containing protein [Streptomyces sp. NBC_00582]|uniref:zf-HC2 domain-containing protein n=1 Tax=Streptomyces sp. NBC_00582 TaxID=2975783 RepID=UPI001062D06C|nr:zf-HC2 domain-containing protein [Streptomyces sp. NBC_00582]WUB64692.1 zf-HC2 domain-containing protein [Streptomyces sp. NBC_00582]